VDEQAQASGLQPGDATEQSPQASGEGAPTIQTIPKAGEEATPQVPTLVQTGLVSTFAGGIERLDGGAFGPTSKGYIVLILEYLERELQRTTRRLENFEERERQLVSQLGTEQTKNAVLTIERDEAKKNQRTQNLFLGIGGAIFGLGLSSAAAITQSLAAGKTPDGASFVILFLGVMIGGAMMIASWKM
jgi:hypothetical protein